MPKTALSHFHQDISRANALVTHAISIAATGPNELTSDILRSAWMFAVGALDAYFSDAYADLIAATLIAKERCTQANIPMNLPDFFLNIRVPVRTILESYDVYSNWKWRMAARKLMEKENVLRLDAIQKLFNPFFRKNFKLYGDVFESWILHPDARVRLTATDSVKYLGFDDPQKDNARKLGKEKFEDRFESIFQRRHDCIHNCDRPRNAPRPIDRPGTVLNVIHDVKFLVFRCDEHINSEFPQFLLTNGCTQTIIKQAGY